MIATEAVGVEIKQKEQMLIERRVHCAKGNKIFFFYDGLVISSVSSHGGKGYFLRRLL